MRRSHLPSLALLVALTACQQDEGSTVAPPKGQTSAEPKAETPKEAPEETKPREDLPPQADPDGETTTPVKPKGVMKDGFFVPEGAPDPLECKTDSDCLGDTIPDPDNPCCQDPYSLRPYTRAYKTWVTQWRQDNCEDVTCPPPPNPSLPPDCAFKVTCTDGVCEDTCP